MKILSYLVIAYGCVTMVVGAIDLIPETAVFGIVFLLVGRGFLMLLNLEDRSSRMAIQMEVLARLMKNDAPETPASSLKSDDDDQMWSGLQPGEMP